MKRKLSILCVVTGWFAVIAQYFLMLENRVASIPETTIRFFSFFTILSNSIVVIYFTWLLFDQNHQSKLINRPGTLTAITVYITIVCLVYQFALRHIWQPTGLQKILDELLHTVIPVLVIIFWSLYETTKPIKYTQVAAWAIYPLIYLAYILVRGSFSNFYPYPFVNVSHLGMEKVLLNSGGVVLLFLTVSLLFIFIGKTVIKR